MAEGSGALGGIIGGGKGPAKQAGKKAPAKKATAEKKAPAKKAAAKKEGGVVRAPSTVSKEGTQKDAFTGEVLPVTAFPTMKNKDGETVRGPVARKNLDAYRAERKKNREAAKAAKAEADKAAKAEKAAKAAKEKEAKEKAADSE